MNNVTHILDRVQQGDARAGDGSSEEQPPPNRGARGATRPAGLGSVHRLRGTQGTATPGRNPASGLP